MRRQPSEKEEFWRFVLSQQIESGLSVRNFCNQEGLSEPSFYAWRRKIAERDGELQQGTPGFPASGVLPVKVTFATDAKTDFVNSGLATGSLLHDERQAIKHQGLEITTPTGFKVRVGETCSLELIERTFGAIRLLAGRSSSC